MDQPFPDDTLLARWLAGELTPAEERELRARPDFAAYEKIVAAADELRPPAYDAAAALQRLKARRTADPPPQLRSVRRPRRRWLPYAAAAAVALLVLAVWLLRPPAALHFAAPLAGRETADLPDGSTVRLNAGTALDFVETARERTATLDGEAFFEVDPGAVPFTVRTAVGTVTVLGTAFNVYARDTVLRVSCTSGRVAVRFRDDPEAVILTARQTARLVDDRAAVRPWAPGEEEGWQRGVTRLDDRPLAEAVAELERQFDLEIVFPRGYDLRQTVRARFPNDAVDEALAIVLGTLRDVKYRREGRRVTVE